MRILIFLLLILAAGALRAQTLDDYLKMAAENNPGLRASRTEHQAALQRLPQARALPDPTVNASVFLRPMMLPMGNELGSISAMQMFPWFGARDAMENEAAQMAAVKDQQTRVAENELFFRVKNAWYPLFELEAQLRLKRENLRVLQTDKELATAKFSQGQAPMTDAIRADIMIDEMNTEIALLEQKRKPLEAAFNRLLNRDDNLPVPLSGSLPEPTAVLRRDSMLAGNPALAVFDRQIQAAAAEEKAAAFQRKPMIGVGLQYMPLIKRKGGEVNLPPNEGGNMIMPMVSVTVPIWRKKYNAAVEERRLMQSAYADMKQDMGNELSAMYEMTRYELDVATQTFELLNKQLLKTQQAIDLLMAAYSHTGADFDEVLRLQQQVFRYRLEQVSAQTAYQLALVKLDYLSGN